MKSPDRKVVSTGAPSSGAQLHYRLPVVNFVGSYLLARSVLLSWFFIWYRTRRNIFATDFDIIIDGYPRSANTYASTMIRRQACDEMSIASHFHNPSAVIAAVKMRKPALVLIRTPEDAIASWTVYNNWSLLYTTRRYIDYYMALREYRNAFELGSFDEVTSDYQEVLNRVNRRFATDFVARDKNYPVFKVIEEAYQVRNNGIDERKVPRPSKVRNALLLEVRRRLLGVPYRPLLEEARLVYQEFTNGENTD